MRVSTRTHIQNHTGKVLILSGIRSLRSDNLVQGKQYGLRTSVLCYRVRAISTLTQLLEHIHGFLTSGLMRYVGFQNTRACLHHTCFHKRLVSLAVLAITCDRSKKSQSVLEFVSGFRIVSHELHDKIDSRKYLVQYVFV